MKKLRLFRFLFLAAVAIQWAAVLVLKYALLEPIWQSVFISLAQFAALVPIIIIVSRSNLLESVEMKVIYGFLAFLCIGMLFKIMHWAGADGTILFAICGITVTYAVRFGRKATKHRIDFLKVIFVFLMCFSYLFNLFHWQFGSLLSVLHQIFGLILLADYFFFAPGFGLFAKAPQTSQSDSVN